MNKLWLIFKREYLTRVKKRSFILTTILTPLAFALFFIVVGFIFAYESGEKKRIVISDEAGVLENTTIPAQSDGSLYFIKKSDPLETLKTEVSEGNYDGILVIPAIKNIQDTKLTVYYYSEDQLSIETSSAVENRLEKVIRDYKIEVLGLDKKQLESLDTRVTIDPKPLSEEGEDVSSMAGIIAAAIGSIMGIIMYMTVFIYGMMVMRSVMEEKTNRIVEVMISSVRPFQLMLGKILGVGAVGLTQIAIWAILIPLVYFLVFLIFGFDPNQMNTATTSGVEIDPENAEYMVAQIMAELSAQNWWAIFPLFVFYFLGGYILYASMFAAVGSAMGDDLGESQSLTLPITIPVIIAFYIMFVAVRSPDSSLAVWSSIFPLFSPIVMPARLAFSPPAWQVLLSVATLIAGSLFFTWLSARIYRVGILMYGKKVTFKELGKWMFYKD